MSEKKSATVTNELWRFPDFIIAGAMKCGTTSLHKILNYHPDIFIPDREIHFFDIDDMKQHPDFFQNYGGDWFYPSFNKNLPKYLDWYANFFAAAEPGQLIGEDSTTYIASDKAAERIAKLNPDVKLIIMLRDPATRTYSHYWHIVRSGRALWSFEKMLQIMPDNLIQRSLYKKQINDFLNHFPRDNMHFVLLENFARNPLKEVEKVCRFIGVNPRLINLDSITTHGNPAKIPKNLSLQLWRNRLMRLKARKIYLQHLIDLPNQAMR